jgi:hypothetical protein
VQVVGYVLNSNPREGEWETRNWMLKAWFPRIEANVWTGHILQEEESNGVSKK